MARRTVLMLCVIPAVAGVGTLAALSGLRAPPAVVVAAVFVMTHALYILSVSVCDSYLSHLGDDRAGLSSFAWGFGYLGGVICLVVALAAQGARVEPAPGGFWVTAVFFGGVASVAIALLPAQAGRLRLQLVGALKQVVERRLVAVLAAFWLINEGIVTAVFFIAVFGRGTLELDTPTIGAVFVVVQLLAFPGTWAVGRAAQRWGIVRVIGLTVVMWCALLLGLAAATTLAHYAMLCGLSSLVLGSTQALMRAHYSRLYPPDSAGLSFGLYALVTKSSTVVGPLVFGLVSSATGSQRLAILCTIVPLALGGLLFASVSRRR